MFIGECIENEWPKSKIAKALGMNIHTFDKLLLDFEIDYKGNKNGSDKYRLKRDHYMPLEEYLKTTQHPKTATVKYKLLAEGYKDAICENCRRREWLNGPIPLELHHVDGNHNNVDLDNLQLLCPNCHALTPNYRSKGQFTREELDDIEYNLLLIQNKNYDELCAKIDSKNKNNIKTGKRSVSVRNNEKAMKRREKCCPSCGKMILGTSELCVECAHKAQRKCERPTKDELLNLVLEYPMLQIGKMYGVRDNTIRKWCKSYGLPYRYEDIQNYKRNTREFDQP